MKGYWQCRFYTSDDPESPSYISTIADGALDALQKLSEGIRMENVVKVETEFMGDGGPKPTGYESCMTD